MFSGESVRKPGSPPDRGDQVVQLVEEEPAVLEVRQHPEVHQDAAPHQRALAAAAVGRRPSRGEQVVQRRRRGDEQRQAGVPRRVEVEAGDHQQPHPRGVPAPRQQPVRGGDDQEEEHEPLRLEERRGQHVVQPAEVRHLGGPPGLLDHLMRLAELLGRQRGHLLRRQRLEAGGLVRELLNLFGRELRGLGEQGHRGAVLGWGGRSVAANGARPGNTGGRGKLYRTRKTAVNPGLKLMSRPRFLGPWRFGG